MRVRAGAAALVGLQGIGLTGEQRKLMLAGRTTV